MTQWKASLRALGRYSLFQKRFYRKSLLILLVAICLPTAIIGSGVKWIGTRQLENTLLTSRNHQLVQSAQRVDEALSYLEKAATQWAFNPDFGGKLKSLETDYNYELIRSVFTNLLLLKESNPLIGQVYLYMDRPGLVLSENNGITELRPSERPRFHELLNHPYPMFWMPSFQTAAGSSMLTLVYQLPADRAEPFGALLIYVRPEALAKTLNGSTWDENGAAILFNENGERIGGFNETEKPEGLRAELAQRIRQSGPQSGSLVYEEGRDTYSLAYVSFKRLGKSWTYAAVDSLDTLNRPVIAASNFVYLLGLAGLLAGILTALFVSRKLYQPIQGLVKVFRASPVDGADTADEIAFIAGQWERLSLESRTLEDRLRGQLPTMKEGFLLQLLQGHFQFSRRSELEERMQLFGWDTEETGFVVLGIQLHGSARSLGRFEEGDQELVAFAAVNIAEELLKDSFLKSEIVNFHDLSLSVLLGCPFDDEVAERRQELDRVAEQLARMLYRFLRMDVTVCLSKFVTSVVEIPQAQDEVNRLVRYRDLNEREQVINAEDYLTQGASSIRYPFAAESELMQAVRQMDEAEARRALERFCEELKLHATKEYVFHQGMLQLYSNLQFGFLKAGYNPFETGALPVQEELAGISDPAAIADIFEERVIRPYVANIRRESEKQEGRLKQAIEQMIETIHREYRADLSLDQFAEEHGLTPLTLSKSFKKATGINFIHYLTDVRLRKAKELLAGTDEKINDIAEKVGYQPTYFNRIFKKTEGVTPSQYRELAGGKPTEG